MSRSRINQEKWQDLELRLAPSFLSKGGVLPSTVFRASPQFITIEDDEDEVQVYAPTFSRELVQTRKFFPCPSSSLEEDLDLRLGIGVSDASSLNTTGGNTCCEASKNYFTLEHQEVKLRCTICMDTMKEETSTLCGHIFCKPCITDTIFALKKCPTCRKELSISSIHRIFLPGAIS